MSRASDDSSQGFGERANFEKTLWGQVFTAGKQGLPESQEAMAALYRTYSLPIYSFMRRSGHDCQKAKERAHDFFGYLWEQNLLGQSGSQPRPVSHFLVGVLKKFVQSEYRRENRHGHEFLSLDVERAEGVYACEPATDETPESIFERHWVLTVLAQARGRLRVEFLKHGTLEEFEAVEPFLTGEKEEGFASLAQRLGKTEGAARTSVSRLRARHRELILAFVADTLANKEDAEKELAHLVDVLRGCR